jgi:hypothetical protein
MEILNILMLDEREGDVSVNKLGFEFGIVKHSLGSFK